MNSKQGVAFENGSWTYGHKDTHESLYDFMLTVPSFFAFYRGLTADAGGSVDVTRYAVTFVPYEGIVGSYLAEIWQTEGDKITRRHTTVLVV